MSVEFDQIVDDEPWWISHSFPRKSGGPPSGWTGPPPPKGCEIFIGKIPRNLSEDQLLPIFSKVGLVYELRLMVDFWGCNKGYCFVVYCTRDQAKSACQQLNKFEIEPGKHIGVVMSDDTRRLFVGGIPRELHKDDIKSELSKLSDGVVDVILYPNATDKSKNRGFAFVEYDSHRAAAMARQKLIRERVQLWGQPVCVDWAEPEQDVDDKTMANVKVLYVRNLMLTSTEESLCRLFQDIRPGSVEKVKKLKDYAFVHFFNRNDALYCMEKTNGITFECAQLEVVLAKPPDRLFMRYPTNGQKLVGGPMSTQRPMVHQSVVAAGKQTYAAAAAGHVQVPPGQLTPSDTLTPPSPPSGTISAPLPMANPMTWAYTPFADSGYNTTYHQAMTLGNERFGGNGFSRLNHTAGYPTLSNSQAENIRNRYVQQLEKHCIKQAWGDPIYELTTVLTKEGGGRDIHLFIYKVTIPSLTHHYGSFQPQQSNTNPEEAKEYAAMFTLIQLGLPLAM